jgi:peptidoglycan-associated lipoprotein
LQFDILALALTKYKEKTMKKIIKLLILSVLVTSTVTACKKNPKDQAQTGADGAGGTAGGYGVDGADISDLATQEGLVATAGDRVFFNYDSAALDENAMKTLRSQAAWALKHNNVTVTVEGHCDERGTREYNLALGEKRANAVKSYLISLGVDASRVQTISYGKEFPEYLGSNEEAWSKNRRGITVVN